MPPDGFLTANVPAILHITIRVVTDNETEGVLNGMAANPQDLSQHYFSLDEYFALEAASDARFEYWDGDIVCMSGGSRQHGAISGNVFYRLRRGLESGSCRAYTADTAIWTPTLPPYRYPGVSAACG